MTDPRQSNMHLTGTIKDAHSPSGQIMYVPENYADLPDCRACGYGTPIPKGERVVCEDCGHDYGPNPNRRP